MTKSDSKLTSRPQPRTDDQTILTPTAADRASFGAAFERIVGLMARLRGPHGCPWDREQDLKSLKPFLVEEAYEVLEAIDDGTADDHREELGDLLLQVVFQAEIRRQAGEFDAADVAHTIADKLVRRHPHVFAPEGDDPDASEVPASWEAIKRKEKGDRSAIGGVPRALPSLLRAQRITEKASRVGFDWPSADGPLDKLEEELGELRAAVAVGDAASVRHELGDLLFSLVNLARFLEADAEDALRGTVDRFERRFVAMEASIRAEGRRVDELDIDELEARWQAAKRTVG